MTFVHQDAEFAQLVQIVARSTGIAAALIERDYRVTHTLWAIHQTGLDIWFKGGTSLSKGFGLIQRFSEDLDLMVERGTVGGLPAITNWTSTNKGPLAKRRAFYDALAAALVVPDVAVEQDVTRKNSKNWIAEAHPIAVLMRERSLNGIEEHDNPRVQGTDQPGHLPH